LSEERRPFYPEVRVGEVKKGGYRSGWGADEHILIGVVGHGINERLDPIQSFVSFECCFTEIIEVIDWNEGCLFITRALTNWRHNNLFIVL